MCACSQQTLVQGDGLTIHHYPWLDRMARDKCVCLMCSFVVLLEERDLEEAVRLSVLDSAPTGPSVIPQTLDIGHSPAVHPDPVTEHHMKRLDPMDVVYKNIQTHFDDIGLTIEDVFQVENQLLRERFDVEAKDMRHRRPAGNTHCNTLTDFT